MEKLRLRQNGETIEILGFPNAAMVICIDGPKARSIADLWLHNTDLEFADECLRLLIEMPKQPEALREALWRCAVVHFPKCFGGNKSRRNLRGKAVYKSRPDKAMEAFEFINALRNKHLVHDDNSLTECVPGAILNRVGATRKIARVVCLDRNAATREPDKLRDSKFADQFGAPVCPPSLR
jgi:hypothetical protein